MSENVCQLKDLNPQHVDIIPLHEPKFALFSCVCQRDIEVKRFFDDIKEQLSSEDINRFESIYKQNLNVGKIRGAFLTEKEANLRAEEIVKNDQNHSVFTQAIGVYFPIVETGYAEEIEEIEIKGHMNKSIEQNTKEKIKKCKEEIENIKKREKELKELSTEDSLNPEERYITNRTKLAYLRYEKDALTKKKEEIEQLEEKCVDWLKQAMKENPEFEEIFKTKCKAGREAAKLPPNEQFSGFTEYLENPI